MTPDPNVLWLSVSPYLKGFDQRLLSQLTKTAPIRRWEYCQTIDEPCSIKAVVSELHGYVESRRELERTSGNHHYKVHLAGHGVSGIVGLMYARQYPEHVASLTLVSVAARPTVNWQAHYYALRQLLPCSREMVLAQMTRLLFGEQPARFAKALSQLLAKDLDSNLTLHSLAHHAHIPASSLKVPVLVCNGDRDAITSTQNEETWNSWVPSEPANNASFQRWSCPEGNHFFHFYHAAAVASVIREHWSKVANPNNGSVSSITHPNAEGRLIAQVNTLLK